MKSFVTVLMSLLSLTVQAAEPKDLVLNNSNTIVLNQPVFADTTAAVMDKAQKMDAKLKSNEPIYLVLDTPGGSIQAGLEMITFLKSLNRPVHTVTIFAASMGFQTVQGLGNRYITHFGTLMAHKARGQFGGEFPGQLDSRYVYYLKRLNELDRIAADRTKGKYTVKTLQALYENEYWVDGFDAVKEGFADEVVSIKCDHSLNGTREEIISFFGFSIQVTWSECPAITGPVAIKALVQTDQGLLTLEEFLKRGGSLSRRDTYSYSNNDYFSGSSSTTYGPQPLKPTVKAPMLTVDTLSLEAIEKEVNKVREDKARKKIVIKDYAEK